jgi:DmsE family decaheme c-type cytochrome
MRKAALLGLLLAWPLASLSGARLRADDRAAAAPQRERAFTKYAEIAGAERVGSGQCQACHADESKTHAWAVHRDVECEDCHGPGSLHAASQEGYGNILGFTKRSAEEANGVCLACHASRTGLHTWFSSAHQTRSVRCADCHREHSAQAKIDSRRERNATCLRCHRKQEAEGSLPYHHPVREARMSCTDCHDPHGGSSGNGLRADSVNELCFQCHAELQGPFSYQHPPVTENCATCHTTHGSMQRNLLKVSEPMLCLQCHPGHHNGSGVPLLNRCTNCHSAIHGTDTPSATGGSVFIEKH